MPSFIRRAYRLLLRAYPPSFRRTFGGRMEEAFARGWDWAGARGLRGRVRFVAQGLLDWLISVPREWLDVAGFNEEGSMRAALNDLLQDVRYGCRGLMRRPTMTVALTVTLGFGIGGVTAIESVLRGTLFRGLPYAEPERIHLFSDAGSWAPSDLAAIEEGSPVLEAVAAYHVSQVVVRGFDGGVTAEDGLVVSRAFFDVLGTGLHLGTGFQPADFAPGAPGPAIVTHGLWQELGADAERTGSFVTLDGAEVQVVGVTPPGFYFPDPGTRIYRPMQLDPASRDRFLSVLARVTRGTTSESLAAVAGRVTGLLGRADEEGAQPLVLTRLRDAVFGRGSETMLLTAGALGLVLLMALMNVGTLLLSHMQQRMSELALRRAIGARWSRLTRQLVTESALLGLLGAGAAMVVGVLGHRVLIGSLPVAEGDAALLAVGPRFIVITLALGVALGALTGLSISLLVPRSEGPAVRGAGRRQTPRAAAIQHALVVTQIGLSVAMVGGAGVMIRSVDALSSLETGVSPGASVVLDLVAGAADFPAGQRAELYRALRDGLAALPETEAVGLTQKAPLRGSGWTTSVRDPGSSQDPGFVSIRFVSAGYFEALGVPVVAGRTAIASLDGAGGAPAAWVNESLAERLWPGAQAAGGRQLEAWGVTRQVVGVVGDVSEGGLTDGPAPTIYVPIEQTPRFLSFTVVARPRPGAETGYASLVQRRLREAHPRVAVETVMPFREIEETAQGDTLMIMRLLVLIGSLALVVGAVGVHGVVSHWVGARVRGWAVSLALGATPRGVLAIVLRRGLALTAAGVALGLVMFAAGGAALESFLYGVERLDATTLLLTAVVMLGTGIGSAVVPAVRAGRTDPVTLLKLP